MKAASIALWSPFPIQFRLFHLEISKSRICLSLKPNTMYGARPTGRDAIYGQQLEDAMIQKELTINNKHGLHARPAAQFVKAANSFKADIWVEKDDERINGKSIMGLMMLAAGEGSRILVMAEGDDESEAINALETLVTGGFDEE